MSSRTSARSADFTVGRSPVVVHCGPPGTRTRNLQILNLTPLPVGLESRTGSEDSYAGTFSRQEFGPPVPSRLRAACQRLAPHESVATGSDCTSTRRSALPGTRTRTELILSQLPLPIGLEALATTHRGLGGLPGIRTRTGRPLRPLPLPVGLEGRASPWIRTRHLRRMKALLYQLS